MSKNTYKGECYMKKEYYIYLTTNLVNGKKYIGQHYGDINDKYLGSGVAFTRALNKYGKENFQKEILEVTTKDKVNEREQYYINLYNAFLSDEYYNLTPGGESLNVEKINQAKEQWQKEHPEEHQNQIDKWRIAGSKANSKKVLCITTNEEFESASAAGRFYNIPQPNISKCCRGERNSAGKHPETGEKMVWKYI